MGYNGYGPLDTGNPNTENYDVDASVSMSNFEPGMGMNFG